jgi:hypothetical protein
MTQIETRLDLVLENFYNQTGTNMPEPMSDFLRGEVGQMIDRKERRAYRPTETKPDTGYRN